MDSIKVFRNKGYLILFCEVGNMFYESTKVNVIVNKLGKLYFKQELLHNVLSVP